MYAVVEIAGQQFKVAKDQRLYVHRLNASKGDNVDFDNVLLVDNDGKVNVGAPAISGARVTAKVLGHLKGDKVIVFKKKRRKGYQKSNGHRQYLTQIEIQQILESGAKAKSSEEKPKAKAAAKSEEKAEAKPEPKAEKKSEPKAEAKPAAKTAEDKPKAAPKKEAPKAEAEKKAPAKKAAPKKEESKAKDAGNDGDKKDDK